jgi:WD40 repeat protein
MIKFDNENILSLVITTFPLSKIKHTYNITRNKTINIIALNKLSYDNIFKQIGRTKIELETTKEVTSMAILSNDKVALISGNKLQIWDMTSYDCINTLLERVNMVLALPDNKIVVSTCTSGLVFFDVNNNYKQCSRKTLLWLEIDDIFLLTNGNILCSTWSDIGFCKNFNNMRVLDCNSGYDDKEIIQVDSPFSAITNISIDKFTTAYDKDIYLWDIANRYQSFKVLKGHSEKVICLLYMDKPGFLISGSEDSLLKVWNMNSYECYKTIAQDIMAVSLLLLPNGYFAASFEDETMTIWNVKGFVCVNHIKSKERQGIASMLLLNDNRIICSSYDTKLLILEY